MSRRSRARRAPRKGGRRPVVADALLQLQETRDAERRDAFPGRRRRSIVMSLLLHAVLLTAMLVLRPAMDDLGSLTEIAYIEEAALQPAAAVASVRETAQPTPGAPNPGRKEVRFARRPEPAEQQPEPQDDYSLSDQLASRLASMRSTTAKPVSGLSTPQLQTPRAAGLAPATVPSPRLALERGKDEPTAVPPIALRRSTQSQPARVRPAALTQPSERATPASAGGDATASVRLAGADLLGPVANRPIISHQAPAYPEWARREAIEASVSLRFVVRADGSIKENILVERTSGYEDFDDRALGALSRWRFAPLHEGRTGEQWGVITLHFRLREAKS